MATKPAYKPKPVMIGDTVVRPPIDERSWSRTAGGYIAGRAYLDGADETAAEMESKWGADRLRLLVSSELREKFDRQRYLLNQAVWHGELEDVRREANRMVTAWLSLDKVATAGGHAPLSREVWEIGLSDGSVAAIVPTDAHARLVNGEGRQVAVYTLDEIAQILNRYAEISRAKLVIPGAVITAVRRSIDDPLDGIHDTSIGLDDPLPDGW